MSPKFKYNLAFISNISLLDTSLVNLLHISKLLKYASCDFIKVALILSSSIKPSA